MKTLNTILILLLLAGFSVKAQSDEPPLILQKKTTKVICDGTTVNRAFLPFFGNACEQSQVMYPTSYLTQFVNKEITGMTFFSNYDGGLGSRYTNAEVRLATKTLLETDFYDFQSISGMTRVYGGVISNLKATGTMDSVKIKFDIPFLYKGDNLLIDVSTVPGNTTSWESVLLNVVGVSRGGSGNISRGAASTTCPATGNVSQSNILPKVMIEYMSNFYLITPTADNKGKISPDKGDSYEEGTTPVFNITPNLGYEIDKVEIDGKATTIGLDLTSKTYTFPALTTYHTIHVTFKPIVYNITYTNVVGVQNTNPLSYTIETPTINLADVNKAGYIFEGWYDNAGFSGAPISKITQGSTGDIKLWAKWTIITYDITYHNGHDVTNNNPIHYTVESPTFALTGLTKEGYAFVGWYEKDDFSGAPVAVIMQGTTGHKEFWGRWIVGNPYTITYHDDKGATNNNPRNYTVATPTFALTGLTKEGYDFDGWFEKNDFSGNAVTQIVLGTTGNKELWAKWSPTVYKIIYYNTKAASNSNDTTYTIETSTFTLKDLIKEGYDFDGWFDKDDIQVTVITKGTIGNIELWADWAPIPYGIEYKNVVGATHPNPATYTIDETPIELEPAVKAGYDFEGWYDKNNVQVTKIKEGTTGHWEFSAKWEIATYNIEYFNLEGATPPALTTYTITQLPLTLPILTEGPDAFGGWYNYNSGTPEPPVLSVIAAGTTGDLKLWALWGSNILVNSVQNVHVYSYMNTVYIVNENQIPLKFVEITDVTGRVVYRSTSVQSPISLNIAEGVYVIRLMSDDSVLNTKVTIKN